MPADPRAPLRGCFSTLGCPELDLEATLALARRHGFGCVELRALGGSLDLPAHLAQTLGTPAEFARRVHASGVQVVALDTSWRLVGAAPADRAAFLAHLPWAEALGGVGLRVFDGQAGEDAATRAEAQEVFGGWHEERARLGWRSTLLVETHDSAITSGAISALFKDAPASVGLLWDSHHTWRRGGEDPVATWREVRRWTRHIHVKDSVARPAGGQPFGYVLPGQGGFPARPLLDELAGAGFGGPVSLEWERLWHPELPPLDQALVAARAAGWL